MPDNWRSRTFWSLWNYMPGLLKEWSGLVQEDKKRVLDISYPRMPTDYDTDATVVEIMNKFDEIRDLFYHVLDSMKIVFPDVQPGGTFAPDGPERKRSDSYWYRHNSGGGRPRLPKSARSRIKATLTPHRGQQSVYSGWGPAEEPDEDLFITIKPEVRRYAPTNVLRLFRCHEDQRSSPEKLAGEAGAVGDPDKSEVPAVEWNLGQELDSEEERLKRAAMGGAEGKELNARKKKQPPKKLPVAIRRSLPDLGQPKYSRRSKNNHSAPTSRTREPTNEGGKGCTVIGLKMTRMERMITRRRKSSDSGAVPNSAACGESPIVPDSDSEEDGAENAAKSLSKRDAVRAPKRQRVNEPRTDEHSKVEDSNMIDYWDADDNDAFENAKRESRKQGASWIVREEEEMHVNHLLSLQESGLYTPQGWLLWETGDDDEHRMNLMSDPELKVMKWDDLSQQAKRSGLVLLEHRAKEDTVYARRRREAAVRQANAECAKDAEARVIHSLNPIMVGWGDLDEETKKQINDEIKEEVAFWAQDRRKELYKNLKRRARGPAGVWQFVPYEQKAEEDTVRAAEAQLLQESEEAGQE